MPKFELPKIEVPTIDLKTVDLPDIPPAAAKPIYAGVGATDLAVEKVKAYVADVQAKVTAKVAEVQTTATTKVADVQKAVKEFKLPEPKDLQGKAVDTVSAQRSKAESRFAELQADAKALPTTVRGKYDDNVAAATAAYSELAKRGEVVVTRLRKGEGPAGTVAKNQAPAPQETPEAVKAPATKAEPKPAAKAPAKKTAAKKVPAKKTAAKKTTAS